jgi:hypothetical protein
MSPKVLNVSAFEGVMLAGSPLTRKISQLDACENYEIGLGGQIQIASMPTDYLVLNDQANPTPNPWTRIYGLFAGRFQQKVVLYAVGQGTSFGGPPVHFMGHFTPRGESSPVNPLNIVNFDPNVNVWGFIVTACTFPYVTTGQQFLTLFNVGARGAQNPRDAPGLWAISDNGQTLQQVKSLGIGTNAVPLYFRGIEVYNNMVFGYGFDNSDATHGDGPNRLMFSNVTFPLLWGNDNISKATPNRPFTDSDAVPVGSGDEAIRGLRAARGRLWIGTNRGLHYIEASGRQSIKQDGGSVSRVTGSLGCIGPNAMCQGPDGKLYYVSPQGLCVVEQPTIYSPPIVNNLGAKLWDGAGHSRDWWDLIWFDQTASILGYPGQTNQDLVSIMVDQDMHTIRIVIPYCDPFTGYGPGTDTVMINYHVSSGGFSRVIMQSNAFTGSLYLPREQTTLGGMFLARSSGIGTNIQRYAFRNSQADDAPLPPNGGVAKFRHGPVYLFGAEGEGTDQKFYLTVSWKVGVEPDFEFGVAVEVDGNPIPPLTITIGAVQPDGGNGDMWVDTSNLDTSLGNATAGTSIKANNGFQIKRYVPTWGKWVRVPGGGQQENRVTIPIAVQSQLGNYMRVEVSMLNANAPHQIEVLGYQPAILKEAV